MFTHRSEHGLTGYTGSNEGLCLARHDIAAVASSVSLSNAKPHTVRSVRDSRWLDQQPHGETEGS